MLTPYDAYMLAVKQANPLDRLLDSGQTQTYDRETHAKILAQKAKFNRSRLVYQQTFRKLPPEGQQEILKHFDSYNRTINKAVIDGKYPLGGSF